MEINRDRLFAHLYILTAFLYDYKILFKEEQIFHLKIKKIVKVIGGGANIRTL